MYGTVKHSSGGIVLFARLRVQSNRLFHASRTSSALSECIKLYTMQRVSYVTRFTLTLMGIFCCVAPRKAEVCTNAKDVAELTSDAKDLAQSVGGPRLASVGPAQMTNATPGTPGRPSSARATLNGKRTYPSRSQRRQWQIPTGRN